MQNVPCLCGGQMLRRTSIAEDYHEGQKVIVEQRVFFWCPACRRKYGGLIRDEAALRRELAILASNR